MRKLLIALVITIVAVAGFAATNQIDCRGGTIYVLDGKIQFKTPVDSSTKLLLHCDGTHGSTNVPDSSASNYVATLYVTACLTTNTLKFGTASLYFDGNSDFAVLPDSSDWDFNTGDFTIDTWVKWNTHTNVVSCLLSTYAGATGWSLEYVPDNTLFFYWGNTVLVSGSYTPTNYVWDHIAVVRQSTNLTLYVRGISLGTVANSTNMTGGTSLGIGAMIGVGFYSDCLVDEVRISKGIARWTSNFTPPKRSYNQ